MTAVIAGVGAAENDGEDTDRSVPDANDKVDETVVDRYGLESNICVTSSTFSVFSSESFASEPCLPAPVSGPSFAS